MKQLIIVLSVIVCLLSSSACSSASNPEISAPPANMPQRAASDSGADALPIYPFGDDVTVFGVRFGTSIENLILKLGKPNNREAIYSEYWQENIFVFYYNFGEVCFNPYGVNEFKINKSGFICPRGTQVGDSVDSVLGKFPQNENLSADTDGIYYLYGSSASDNRGYIEKDENNAIIKIFYAFGGFGFNSYSLTFEIMDGHVSSIDLFLCDV